MTILLVGQLCSGKNAVRTTRTGQHYSNERFKAWREDACVQLRSQRLIPPLPIDLPVRLKVDYWAGDKRTRDVSGMLDAIFHLLVYSKIIVDDGQVRDVLWYWQGVNKQDPRVLIDLEVKS